MLDECINHTLESMGTLSLTFMGIQAGSPQKNRFWDSLLSTEHSENQIPLEQEERQKNF